MAEPTDRIRGILTARFIVQSVLRLVSIALIATGIYAFCVQLFLGSIFLFGPQGFNVIYDGVTYSGTALGTLALGVTLAILNKRLARWIVPAMRLECPQCGYNLHLIKGETCPECGYVIASPREQNDTA